MNRVRGLNLLFQAATEAIQQWARDVMSMRMGIMAVMHTFGSDLKWNPHVHLVVTGGGLSLDERTWVTTDPRFLMSHKGLKSRWKYQVTTRLKQGHREQKRRFPKSLHFLSEYRCLASLLNKLWCLTWYAFIGASLMDPRRERPLHRARGNGIMECWKNGIMGAEPEKRWPSGRLGG